MRSSAPRDGGDGEQRRPCRGTGSLTTQFRVGFALMSADASPRKTPSISGVWCLLLSWLPVVGDPLTLVAGVLRTAFVPFALLVLIGKAARYLFVLLVVT
jgi:membrane protein YqaA with SNARE-associated domain